MTWGWNEDWLTWIFQGAQKNSPWLPGFHQEIGPKSGMLVVKESLL